MKATVLADNTASCDLKGEWGFSVYIEYNGKHILLDTGASPLFSENAVKLGIDIANVEYAVLSHAHSDHANGMKAFFKLNDNARFYLASEAAENCYAKELIFKKYIGIKRGTLKKFADRIAASHGKTCLTDGVYLLTHSTPALDEMGKRNRMYLKVNGKYIADDYRHEQSLIFDTADGIIVFNSCSHAGADIIIKEAALAFPDKNIKALIGGFHLYNKTAQEVKELAARIKKTGIESIYTGHCTGEAAYKILKDELGSKVNHFKTGLIIHI